MLSKGTNLIPKINTGNWLLGDRCPVVPFPFRLSPLCFQLLSFYFYLLSFIFASPTPIYTIPSFFAIATGIAFLLTIIFVVLNAMKAFETYIKPSYLPVMPHEFFTL